MTTRAAPPLDALLLPVREDLARVEAEIGRMTATTAAPLGRLLGDPHDPRPRLPQGGRHRDEKWPRARHDHAKAFEAGPGLQQGLGEE